MPGLRPQSIKAPPRRPRRRPAAASLALTLLLSIASAGCGSSGHRGLTSADAARLHAEIAAARTAAARHEAPRAASSLVAFRQRVGRLAAEHKLTSAQAQALQAGAQQAQARVALDVKPAPVTTPATTTTPAATTSAAPAPSAPPAPPGKAKGHDKHHGPGGKGDGGD